jgi:hypothetical protein
MKKIIAEQNGKGLTNQALEGEIGKRKKQEQRNKVR